MLIAAALLFLIPLTLLVLTSRGNGDEEPDEDALNWQQATERAMADPHAWPYGDDYECDPDEED